METASMGAPVAHIDPHNFIDNSNFDAADWLARYTALGGVYVANGKLNLCILVNSQTEEQLSQVREMVVALADEDKAAILAFVNSGCAPRRMTWQDVVTRYETAEATVRDHPFGAADPRSPEYEEIGADWSAACAESRRAYLALVSFPAPDHAALRRKIEAVADAYEIDEEASEPLLADVARLADGKGAGPDDAILAAWERRRVAYATLAALPNDDDHASTPEEDGLWAAIREAEDEMRALVASSPAGVSAQLWAGLHTLTPDAWLDGACQSGNLETLTAREHDLDWNERMIVAALRSLKSMGA